MIVPARRASSAARALASTGVLVTLFEPAAFVFALVSCGGGCSGTTGGFDLQPTTARPVIMISTSCATRIRLLLGDNRQRSEKLLFGRVKNRGNSAMPRLISETATTPARAHRRSMPPAAAVRARRSIPWRAPHAPDRQSHK